MAARPFEASVRFRPGVAIVDLHGELDATGEDALNAAYAHANSRSPATILLNFGDMQFMDTTGIALIVGLLGRARADGITVAACRLSDHYREIFEITRLSDFMSIHADEQSARAAAREGEQ